MKGFIDFYKPKGDRRWRAELEGRLNERAKLRRAFYLDKRKGNDIKEVIEIYTRLEAR